MEKEIQRIYIKNELPKYILHAQLYETFDITLESCKIKHYETKFRFHDIDYSVSSHYKITENDNWEQKEFKLDFKVNWTKRISDIVFKEFNDFLNSDYNRNVHLLEASSICDILYTDGSTERIESFLMFLENSKEYFVMTNKILKSYIAKEKCKAKKQELKDVRNDYKKEYYPCLLVNYPNSKRKYTFLVSEDETNLEGLWVTEDNTKVSPVEFIKLKLSELPVELSKMKYVYKKPDNYFDYYKDTDKYIVIENRYGISITYNKKNLRINSLDLMNDNDITIFDIKLNIAQYKSFISFIEDYLALNLKENELYEFDDYGSLFYNHTYNTLFFQYKLNSHTIKQAIEYTKVRKLLDRLEANHDSNI